MKRLATVHHHPAEDDNDHSPLLSRDDDPSLDFERLTSGFRAEIAPVKPLVRNSITYDSRSYRALDDSLDEIGVGGFQYRLLLLTAFGHFVEAAESSVLGLMLPLLSEDFHVNSHAELALIGSLTGVGMMLGTGFFAQVSNLHGRRLAYQASLTICVVFGLLSSFAETTVAFALLRGCLGFGYGGNLVSSTTLLMEFTPSSHRARFMNIAGIAFGLGAVFVVSLGWILVPIIGWRWLLRIIAFCSIPTLLSLPFLPESPRFYIMRQRPKDAYHVMKRVAEANGRATLPRQCTITAFSLYAEPLDVRSQLHRLKDSWRIIVPLSLVWFIHAIAGGITSFLPLEISRRDPANKNAKYQIALTLSLGALLGSFILLFTSARFGRLPQLRWGLVLTGILTAMIGMEPQSGVYVYVIGFVLSVTSMFPISMLYMYTPEVNQTETRTIAFAICQFLHRLAPVFSPFIVAALIGGQSFMLTGMVFGSFFIFAFLMSLLLRVETFGRQLVEADDVVKRTITANEFKDDLAALGANDKFMRI